MEVVIAILVALAVLGLNVLIYTSRFRRGAEVLRKWARTRDYEILDARRCMVWRGPFWATSFSDQVVYRVTVRTPRRGVVRAWVKCGGAVLGTASDKVDVRWDD